MDLSFSVGIFHAHLSLVQVPEVVKCPHGVTATATTGLVPHKKSFQVHLLNCSVDPVLIASKGKVQLGFFV